MRSMTDTTEKYEDTHGSQLSVAGMQVPLAGHKYIYILSSSHLSVGKGQF